MKKTIPPNLFVLEMANNHMGRVSHGITIIQAFAEVCKDFPEFNFAFKLQYRNLDTFIHPDFKNRMDVKYVKRFEETRLSRGEFDALIKEIKANGFLTMATPFDEESVDVVVEQGLDILKVASCSFADWPLLEKIVQTDLPIIASTAGASLEDIDRVVSFLQHRDKDLALLHCVAEYPTEDNNLNLGQLDLFKQRYPGLKIGFSTHESPQSFDIVKVAIAKGAEVIEKHVGLPTSEFDINSYSASPEQVREWLNMARKTKGICGYSDVRSPTNKAEVDSLNSLRRGVFVNRNINAGEILCGRDVYFAFPPKDGQLLAQDWSKYSTFAALIDIKRDAALTRANVAISNSRSNIMRAVEKIKSLLKRSGVVVPGGVHLELSHHYGIEQFENFGLTLITVVNRAYCKKLLVSLPHQFHPEQFHNEKEETFHVLYGEVDLSLNGTSKTYGPGSVINIEPKVRHSFVSEMGCVIEEVSSTHFANDSFYTDESINLNKNRKTLLTHWMS
jgi:sialic acid synthase SpsE/mannose-6-phosphate isomerase-like protein (cupin superfamily)